MTIATTFAAASSVLMVVARQANSSLLRHLLLHNAAALVACRFLSLAAVLGAACTATYCLTSGSLAAAAVVHWLPVAVWLSVLGGYHRLYA